MANTIDQKKDICTKLNLLASSSSSLMVILDPPPSRKPPIERADEDRCVDLGAVWNALVVAKRAMMEIYFMVICYLFLESCQIQSEGKIKGIPPLTGVGTLVEAREQCIMCPQPVYC